jgi:hypothetical protein
MKNIIMNCKETKENLIFYVDGSLNPAESSQFQKHLEGCDECRSSYLFLKNTLRVIEKEKTRDTNPYFSMKVMERLKIQSGPKQISGYFSFDRIYKPSLAFLLTGLAIYAGILLGGSFSQKFERNSSMDSRTEQFQTVADAYFLNDLEIENIETILITDNNK